MHASMNHNPKCLAQKHQHEIDPAYTFPLLTQDTNHEKHFVLSRCTIECFPEETARIDETSHSKTGLKRFYNQINSVLCIKVQPSCPFHWTAHIIVSNKYLGNRKEFCIISKIVFQVDIPETLAAQAVMCGPDHQRLFFSRNIG